MDYRISIDAFHGPLDLLLYLVKKNEVDILDIPLAIIAQQFSEYLELMQAIDMDLAGDFLVMAATLMEIKSRLLLTQEKSNDETPTAESSDPRQELVRQLLEYRRFKEAASQLEQLAEKQQAYLPREPVEQASSRLAQPHLRKIELWDLVSAFRHLMREAEALKPRQIIVDDTPQHVYEALLREQLRDGARLSLAQLFTPPHHRYRLVGLFLAMLELMKRTELLVEQAEPFGEIWIQLQVIPEAMAA